jgi:hypothetical protein
MQLGTPLLIEGLLLLLALVLAWARPSIGDGFFARVEGALARASSPWAQYLAVAAITVAVRAVLLPILPAPEPHAIPDEYSILLQAETFMQGRLANPTHPFAEHFEAPYVNHRPAYASMYFPGRGLPAYLGLLLFSNAWAGVWLSMVALTVATLWMLRAWVSPGYALLGALLMAVKFAAFSFWVNSYYGGALIALGGVLLLGAYPRLMESPRWREGVALGLGLFLMMVSRPFEGLLFSLPFAGALIWKLGRSVALRHFAQASRLAIPPALAVIAGAGLLASYNLATTGSAALTPYELNRAQYAVVPAFLTSEPTQPSATVPDHVRTFYQWEAEGFPAVPSAGVIAFKAVRKALNVWAFYLGFALSIPFLLGLGPAWRKSRVLVLAGLVLALGFALVSFPWPSYVAPMAGWFMICAMLGLERLRQVGWPKPLSGRFLSRAIPLVIGAGLIPPSASLAFGWPNVGHNVTTRSCCTTQASGPRAKLKATLEALPGRHLVFVRFPKQHPPFVEWIANAPDIDSAKIVWAHDLGPDKNRRLISHLAGRRVWTVTAGDPPRVAEHPVSGS